jgi:hypothetical protein
MGHPRTSTSPLKPKDGLHGAPGNDPTSANDGQIWGTKRSKADDRAREIELKLRVWVDDEVAGAVCSGFIV